MSGINRTRIDVTAADRFVSLRRPLGVTGIGMNLILLDPGQRGRIHAHAHQEEVYIVWDGVLTLVTDGEQQDLGRGDAVSVPPATRRQLVNYGPGRVAVIALGADPGTHNGRDGIVWASWDDAEPAGAPQDLPAPDDLPADQLRH
jgi:mannose-6-phosphate isomerase-like protein (cupin superfamily)